MQTLDQINFTIGSTSELDPLSLCMYMHRSTLVCTPGRLLGDSWATPRILRRAVLPLGDPAIILDTFGAQDTRDDYRFGGLSPTLQKCDLRVQTGGWLHHAEMHPYDDAAHPYDDAAHPSQRPVRKLYFLKCGQILNTSVLKIMCANIRLVEQEAEHHLLLMVCNL